MVLVIHELGEVGFMIEDLASLALEKAPLAQRVPNHDGVVIGRHTR